MRQLALELAVRAALLGAGTAGVLWILRVRAAWAKHAAWTGVLILMMLLPLLTAWGPKARLHLLSPAQAAPATAPESLTLRAWTGSEAHASAAVSRQLRPAEWGWTACFSCLYLLGVGVLLARLLTGTVRAQLLVRRALMCDGHLTSAACSSPVTVGGFNPAVILPICWKAWPPTQLAAVLAHEAAHARRRDPLVQWLALFNRAVFWFHPLAWWLERQLSALAEEACDAAVIEGGCDPLAYSEYLLEIARSVLQTGARIKILGMAMPGRFLSRRIRWILEHRAPQRMTRIRLTSLGVACAAVAAVCTAGAVDRRAPEPQAQTLDFPAPFRPPAPPVERVLMAAAAVQPPHPEPAPQASEPKFNDFRLLVLYFDLQSMRSAERLRAFAAAQTYLKTKLQPTDLISVMTANPEVKVLQDFTKDHEALLRTLDQLAADSGSDRNAAPDPARQVASLQTAVHMLGALKQKKALIYFSVPIPGADDGQLKPLIDEAIRANVAFYDMHGTGPVEAPPIRKNYEIGPLDELQIWVANRVGITGRYVVRPDGAISIPLVGEINASGMTTAQLEAVIVDALRANGILEAPSVTVGIAKTAPRQRMYFLAGHVAKAGVVYFTGPTRVSDALAQAGGAAHSGLVRILREVSGEVLVFHYNEKEVSAGEKLDQNIFLGPGDHVYVE